MREKTGYRQLKAAELAVLCEQLRMVLGAGILLSTGVQAIAEDTDVPEIRSLLEAVGAELDRGQSPSAAFAASGAFPSHFVSMVGIGYETGRLDEVLTALGAYYENRAVVQDNVKSAVLYPLVLLAMLALVLVFLVARVLPVLSGVFNSLGAEVSGAAAVLLGLGELLNRYSLVLVVVAVLLVAGGLWLTCTERGREVCTRRLIGGRLGESFDRANFASAMAMLLASGLDLDRSLELATGTLGNGRVKAQAAACAAAVRDGEPPVQALATAGLVSGLARSMVAMGAQSGSLDDAFDYIAGLYADEFQSRLVRRISLIEPISIGTLSVLIGIILVLVMLPLLGVMAGLG